MQNQPVWNNSSLVALGAAIIALLIAFGIPITEEQKIAVIGLLAVLAPFVVPLLVNSKVTPLTKPEDTDGTPLVRSTDGQVTGAQMRSMIKQGGSNDT